MEGSQEEDVETQLDRLNEVIARTLAAARETVASIDVTERVSLDQSEEQEEKDSFLRDGNYVLTEPRYYAEDVDLSFESDFQDFLESTLLKLERTQMQLEDFHASALRTSLTVLHTEVTGEQVALMLEGLERLQATHYARFCIGTIQIEAHVATHSTPQPIGSGLSSDSTESEHREFRVVWDILQQQKSDLTEREKQLTEREQDFQSQLTAFKDTKRLIEEQHEKFVQAAKKQNLDAMTLKDRIEVLLHDQQESTFDLSSIYASEAPTTGINYEECEAELSALRKQVQEMHIEGLDSIGVKKEMDLAEDILVGVLNGDDPRKLHLQVTVVKNRLVQIRGKQVIRDAEKMANTINMSIAALENDRLLQKSKNRIKEQLIKRLTTPITSPRRSPIRTPVRSPTVRSPVRSPPPEPIRKLIVTPLETVVSPMDSPKIYFQQDDSMFLSPKAVTQHILPQKVDESQEKKIEERNRRLRQFVHELQLKLERYKVYERKLIDQKAQNEMTKMRNESLQKVLEQREDALVMREVEVSEKEDELRVEAARSLNTREARELLTIRAKGLMEQQQKLSKDMVSLEMGKAEIKCAKEDILRSQRSLEKEKKRIMKHYARIEKERKKIFDSKKGLEDLLPKLQGHMAES